MKVIPQDRRKDRHKTRIQRKPFCGVDGEGGSIDGSHEYLLLRAGDHVLETGQPLKWYECLGFLADLPRDKSYVSFFFDYDVTMMLRGIREERLLRIMDKECRRMPKRPCSSYPVNVEDFVIDYMPGKEFRVRRDSQKSWVVVQDTGSFFQCSFVSALRRWFSQPGDERYTEIIDKIAEGKEMRHDFGAVTEHEREYNLIEIRMLEILMERFRNVCDDLDIRPGRWEGPGNLVAAVFKSEKLSPNKDLRVIDEMQDLILAANAAYYGGRFEVSTFGEIQ